MSDLMTNTEPAAKALQHEPADKVAIALSVVEAVSRHDLLYGKLERAIRIESNPSINPKGPFGRVSAEEMAESLNMYDIEIPAELNNCGSHWTPGMASYAFGCIHEYKEYL